MSEQTSRVAEAVDRLREAETETRRIRGERAAVEAALVADVVTACGSKNAAAKVLGISRRAVQLRLLRAAEREA